MGNFFDQLKKISKQGEAPDQFLRGFFLGVAIAIPIALLCCCWYPCFSRETQASRRRRLARETATLEAALAGRPG